MKMLRLWFYVSAIGTAGAVVSEQWILVAINAYIGLRTCLDMEIMRIKNLIKDHLNGK